MLLAARVSLSARVLLRCGSDGPWRPVRLGGLQGKVIRLKFYRRQLDISASGKM